MKRRDTLWANYLSLLEQNDINSDIYAILQELEVFENILKICVIVIVFDEASSWDSSTTYTITTWQTRQLMQHTLS